MLQLSCAVLQIGLGRANPIPSNVVVGPHTTLAGILKRADLQQVHPNTLTLKASHSSVL